MGWPHIEVVGLSKDGQSKRKKKRGTKEKVGTRYVGVGGD